MVPIYLYQDTRSTGNGLWYARATHYGIVTLDDIAAEVERNCSLKISDCLAINREFLEVIGRGLRNSQKVQLGKMGYFKPSISGTGAVTAESYNINERLTRFGVKFVAQKRKVEKGYVKPLIEGAEVTIVPGPLWKKGDDE